jgi:hypothetical protein
MRKPNAYIVAAHVLTFAALLAWSWRKWPDPLVDFGRELYMAWQISEGRVLYRDLASLFGPLSPYVNALWFRLFGTSLVTLALCNTAIFAATIAGIHHLVRIATDRVTATAASLSAVVLFGFSQYLDVGNYNFVTPYSHEATPGIALSVAALVALQHGLSGRSRRYCAVAGWCFGLTLLTKPDIAIASAAGMAAGWATASVVESRERSHFVTSVPAFMAAALAPSVIFFLYFVTQMSARQALQGTAGAFTPLFGTGITANEFYRLGMGLDAPVRRAGMMVFNFAGFIAFAAAAVAISSSGAVTDKRIQALRIGIIIGVFFALSKGTFPTALPLVVLTLLVAAIMLVARYRSDRERVFQQLPLVMWSVFALVLLAKMGFYARFLHYGFYLALPAMVAAVTLTIGVVPQALAAWKSDAAARGFRQLAFYALAAVIAPYVGLSHGWLRSKTIGIGSGSDRMYASTLVPQGLLMQDALNAVEQTTESGTTLAVMPEGVMLNYLLRRHSPLRVVTLMPPELMAFGENEILASLAANPPDVVVLIERDVAEYGYPPFGADRRYGLEIVSWVNEHYEPIRSVQDARILRRRVR